MRYWINVISKDHVLAGQAAGFTQAHGDKARLLRPLAQGDLIFFYSPGTLFRGGEILRAFTGVAQVIDEASHQAEVSPTFRPWRRLTVALPSQETPAEPLAPQLDFITDKANWTASLGRGLFEISERDALRLADAMKVDLAR